MDQPPQGYPPQPPQGYPPQPPQGYPPQPPQGYPPQQPQGYPQQPPPGYPPPQPPGKNGLVKPLLIGCGVLVVLFVLVASAATWFTMRAVGTVVSSARQVADAASSADPSQPGAQGVAVLKSLVNGGKGHVETLPRDELKADLPATFESLPRTGSDSSRGSFSGVSGTSASANFGNGSQTVSIEVTDAANMTGLTAIMGLAMSVESEDDSGYQKTVTLGGVSVHEKWENAGKNAELLGIVGGRFVISVTTSGLGIDEAERAFQSVDIAKLSAAGDAKP